MAAAEHQIDSLSSLEDRIHKAVQLVSRLRQEKEAAVKDAAEARARTDRLSQEVEALRAERQQVRTRIEKLLAQIDQLTEG
jgi:uncharacterized coiled-coil DUF342 family protein